MAKTKRVLSLFVVALMTVFTVLSYVPAKAATAPKLSVVTQPAAEYTTDKTISFTVNAHYAGKVTYRVILYNGTTKTTSNLWNTPSTGYYYTKWTPSGTMNFTIHWGASQLKEGYYSMTVLAKRVGSKAKYETYVDTHSFYVKGSVAIASIEDVTASVDQDATYTLPATVKATMSDGTTQDVAVVWDPATVDTTKVGTQKFVGKVENYDKDVNLTLTVNALPLAVKSVSAINTKQLKVVFTQPVDEDAATSLANYYLNNIALTGIATADIADDDLSVILTLNTALTNGATNIYTVMPIASSDNEDVLTPTYTKTETYKDTIAPTVTSVTSSTNSNYASTVKVTYSEPVVSGALKIDGNYVAAASGSTQDISVTLDATKTHTLEYINLTDYASNVTADATMSFSITKDTTAPVVTNVAPYAEKKVLVTFSKAMGASALVAGNYTAVNETLTPYNILSAVAKSGDTTGTQYVLTIGNSPIYSTTILTHTVTVAFSSNLLDTLGNALAATTRTVTLTKDTVAPYVTDIVAEEDVDGKTTDLLVKYSEGLADNATGVLASSLTIVDTNGVLISTSGLKANSDAIVAGDTSVKFEFTTPAIMNVKWNVTVPASIVTDNTEAKNVSTGFAKLVDMSQTAATTFAVSNATSDGKVITVTFANAVKGGAVTGSATDPAKYSINGTVLPTGTSITFTDTTQKVATITLPSGFIATTDSNAVFRVSNVQDLNSLIVTPYVKTLAVTDNTKPTLTGAVDNADKTVSLSFSETVLGLTAGDLTVTVAGIALTPTNDYTVAAGTGADAGKWVLTFVSGKVPTLGQQIVITTTGVTGADAAANKVVANGTATVYGN